MAESAPSFRPCLAAELPRHGRYAAFGLDTSDLCVYVSRKSTPELGGKRVRPLFWWTRWAWAHDDDGLPHCFVKRSTTTGAEMYYSLEADNYPFSQWTGIHATLFLPRPASHTGYVSLIDGIAFDVCAWHIQSWWRRVRKRRADALH